jgi:hypothetical protein
MVNQHRRQHRTWLVVSFSFFTSLTAAGMTLPGAATSLVWIERRASCWDLTP